MSIDVSVRPPQEKRVYLGDGVYARFDGYHVWLELSTGEGFCNLIALEPQVLHNLALYLKGLGKE